MGLVVHTESALNSGWVEIEVALMTPRRACGQMRLVALRLEPACPLAPGVTWDELIEVQMPLDLDALAGRVAKALPR
jgi:hypothetical protein